MKIALIGDVHGRIYHALAAVLELQARLQRQFDVVIQVGDLGAFPDPDRMDIWTKRWAKEDPSELHFSHLLGAKGALAQDLSAARARLSGPIYFIRGNHEDMEWLASLQEANSADTIPVDPVDLYHHVRDGAVIDFGGFRVAFLGGVEYGAEEHTRIDPDAVDRITGAGSFDLLITHDAPYGVGVGYYGDTQGSKVLTKLIERLQPRHHVGGHYHNMIGPNRYGDTTYYCVASLFPGRQDAKPLLDGCLAVLDTESGSFEFVTGAWLRDFSAGFDFEAHFASLANANSQRWQAGAGSAS